MIFDVLSLVLFYFVVAFLIANYIRFKTPTKINYNIWLGTSIISLILNIIINYILSYDESNFNSISDFVETKRTLERIQNIKSFIKFNLFFHVTILLGYGTFKIWPRYEQSVDPTLTFAFALGIVINFTVLCYSEQAKQK